MTRGWLSREVELRPYEGEAEVYHLSVVEISGDGTIVVTPFVRETPGVEYCDSRIIFEQHADGKWEKA